GIQALLRQDRPSAGFRPVTVGNAETRTRPGAGLSLERSGGVRARLLQASRATDSSRSRPHAAPSPAGGRSLQGYVGHREAASLLGQVERLREDVRFPEPDYSLRRSRTGNALQLRTLPAPTPPA